MFLGGAPGRGGKHEPTLASETTVSRRPVALSLKSNTLLLKNGLGEEGASGLTATDSHVWAEHRRQSDVTPSPPDTTRAGGRETRRRVSCARFEHFSHHVTSCRKQEFHSRIVFLSTARTPARDPQRFRAHFFMFGLAAPQRPSLLQRACPRRLRHTVSPKVSAGGTPLGYRCSNFHPHLSLSVGVHCT